MCALCTLQSSSIGKLLGFVLHNNNYNKYYDMQATHMAVKGIATL